MSVGKRDNIRPGDVVGSIANEAGLSGSDIGPIVIRDTMTFVEVPAESADHVIEKVGRTKFRGKPVSLRRAGDDNDRPARGSTRKPPSRPKTKDTGKRFKRR
jgi:hypothetical protein